MVGMVRFKKVITTTEQPEEQTVVFVYQSPKIVNSSYIHKQNTK